MTTPLDRYLADVRDALPHDVNADDILAEIADDIQSRIDAGENELEAIAAYGNAIVVAGRYRRVQYLIGRQLYSYYLTTLRNVIVATVALILSGGGLYAVLAHDRSAFFASLGIAWNALPWVVIVVTLIFALRERVDSFSLPDRPRRPAALIEFIANMTMLLITIDAPHLAAGLRLTFAPSWAGVYVGTIAATALLAGSAMTVFVAPRFERLHELNRIFASMLTIGGIIYTLANGPAIEPSSPSLDWTVFYAFLGAIVALFVNALFSLRSLARQRPGSPASLKAGY